MVPTERSYHREYSCEISKLKHSLARLKFSKNGSNSKIKVTWSEIMVPTEMSYHRENSCEYLSSSIVQKLLARLKFQRGGQNDRQDKNYMPPRSSISGA